MPVVGWVVVVVPAVDDPMTSSVVSSLLIGVKVYWPGSVSVAIAATVSRSFTNAKHSISPDGSGVGGSVHVTSLGSRSVLVSR